MTNECIKVEQDGSATKCNIFCPKCGNKSSLSPYYTHAGIGFRMNNFARHIDTFHNTSQERVPLADVQVNRLMVQLGAERTKNKFLRSKRVSTSTHSLAKKQRKDNLGGQESNGLLCELQQQKKWLEEENMKLKKELEEAKSGNGSANGSPDTDHESDAKQWREKVNKLESQLAQVQNELNFAHSTALDSSDVSKLREEKEAIKKELQDTKSDLEFVNRERSILLQQLLDLQGKARLMVRFRPPLNEYESSNIMRTKVQSNQTQLLCKYLNLEFNVNHYINLMQYLILRSSMER